MKRTFTVFAVLLMISGAVFAQKKITQEISDGTCECLQERVPSEKEASQFEMMLGLCMLEASTGKQDRIKKELGIDMNSMSGMERLGEVIGEYMAMNCPHFMNLILASMEDENSMARKALEEELDNMGSVSYDEFEGTVTAISEGDILKIEVKSGGMTQRFVCLGEFEGVGVVKLGTNLKGSDVILEYEETQIYSPVKKDFDYVKAIRAIRLK